MVKGLIPRGPWLILIGALCFSTNGLTQALAPAGATPYLIGGLRMLGGGLALLAWCLWRGLRPGPPAGWPIKNVLFCSLGLLFCQIFYFQGVLHVGVAVGTVVGIGFTPISAALLGWVCLGERPAKAWYPATALAILGLFLLNRGDASGLNPVYLLLPLAGGFSYAVYLVFSKPLVQRHPPETVMMCLCLLAGLGLLPFFFFFPTAWLLSPGGLAVALNLSVVTTALALSLTLAGLKTTPTATASTLSMAEPLGAALLGFLFLQEQVTLMSLAGLALILAGVLLLIYATRNRKS